MNWERLQVLMVTQSLEKGRRALGRKNRKWEHSFEEVLGS